MDLRVDLILRVQNDHRTTLASSSQAPKGERWRCACGEFYEGKGSLNSGRRHEANEILVALDAAMAIA